MKRPPPPWKAAEAHALYTLDRPSAAVDAVYTQPHCDGRFEPSKQQPTAPYETTHHPSDRDDSQRHEPSSAAKIIVTASFTMLHDRSITTYAKAAADVVEVGESAGIKLI